MDCFLIDYENEGGRAFNGIRYLNLTENDEIIIFYSNKAFNISMERHRELERVKAKKFYIKVEVGTANALDFQLVTFLGAYIHKNPYNRYFIVSKDQGFECVCTFWKENGIYVKRIESIYNFQENNRFM